MTDTPMKLVIDLSKPEGERETYVPLTDEEIVEREAQAAAAQAAEEARQAELAAQEALKASAREKLIAGEPLTPEEAALLVV